MNTLLKDVSGGVIPIVCLGEISFFMILSPFFHCCFYLCSNAAAIFSAMVVLFSRCFCVNSTQWFMTFKTKTHSNLIFFVFNVKFPIDINFFVSSLTMLLALIKQSYWQTSSTTN